MYCYIVQKLFHYLSIFLDLTLRRENHVIGNKNNVNIISGLVAFMIVTAVVLISCVQKCAKCDYEKAGNRIQLMSLSH